MGFSQAELAGKKTIGNKADGEIRTPDRLITNQEHYHYATPATFAGGLL